MAITFKTASLAPTRTEEVLYTAPSGKNVAVANIIASANDSSQTINIGVRPNGGSTTNWFAQNVSISSGTSSNMVAGDTKLMLGEGDTIRIKSNTVNMFDLIGTSTAWSTTPIVALSDGAGTICVAHQSSGGIWTSTDGGLTFTQTLSNVTFNGCAVYIGGTFYFYTSTSQAYKATDGMTWSTQACTNAPNVQCNSLNSVVQNGSTYAGLTTSTQMVTSTDGITWSNVGAVFPSGVTTLCWTGTNYVAGRSATANPVVAYTSTNGASWASNTIVAANSFCTPQAVANNGGTVLLHTNSLSYYSTDHGVTWASTVQSGSPRLYSSSKFLLSTGLVSTSGLPGTFSVAGGSESTITNLCIDSGKVYAFPSSNATQSRVCASPWTARGGLDVTTSVVEIV